MKTKQEIRDYIKELFLSEDREEREKKDFTIGENILNYIQKNDVQNICIYESITDEIDTKELILKLQEIGKNIYTPQIISDTKMILIAKDYEIYEKEIDLFIIPGRAFTQYGERLGRGKGYYDRLLGKTLYRKSKKLGVCYNFQVFKSIPMQKHDISMDLIIFN